MKKGFTIVELLAVIAIIAVLLILIIPSVSNIITRTEDKGYNFQIKSLEDAAINFTLSNVEVLSSISGLESFAIDLKLLKDLAFIDFDFKNPRTNKYFSDDTLIILTESRGTYKPTVLTHDSDEYADEVKYKNHIILIKNNSTVSDDNVVVLNINGGLFLGEYTVNTSVGEDVIEGYTTNIYTVKVGQDNYEIKKFDEN